MAKKANKTIGNTNDYLKAIKKADREYEIALYGKQISFQSTRVHKSKKVYDRNKMKSISIFY